jgi:phosphonate transport system substrate-binding protein
MTRQFAISPDVHARDLTDWFLLNTRIQRMTGEAFRAVPYDDFAELHAAFDAGAVDLVFANAADTATLVHDRGYLPIVGPAAVSDEAAVVVAADGPLQVVEDLRGSLSVAATDAPDVERICRILLEPADLGREQISLTLKRNYILVAKAVLSGEAQAGFFLSAAFDDLSQVTRNRLRLIISSKIYVVRHCLLASPAIADQVKPILAGLEVMAGNPSDQALLAGLGAPHGWQRMTMDDTQFMIDLMDALEQQ